MRTKSEIQKDFKAARAAFDQYAVVQFEGRSDPDNYYLNPHHKKIEELAAELLAAEQAELKDKLSGDSLKAEQAWFNAQRFTRPDVAQKACRERGYNMSDLFAAIKASKK